MLEILDMCGVAENVCALVKNNMPSWKTRRVNTGNNQYLPEICIKRAIYHGDSCSLSYFVIDLILLSGSIQS